MNRFSFYDITGVLAPGAVVLVCALLIYADPHAEPQFEDLSFGGFGLFVILAYVAGQLTQAVGNLIERAYWALWGGMPSDWARTSTCSFLSDEQQASLESRIGSKLGIQLNNPLAETRNSSWFAITRQVYASVAAAKRADRVDAFNAVYGLNRGVGSAFVIATFLVLVNDPSHWQTALALALAAIIAFYRMHRFAVHYARELFVQFLQLPVQSDE